MILSTTETIPNREIKEIIGLVEGNTVRTRNVGRDILAILKNLIGGEIHNYTKLMTLSREEAIDRMVKEAEELNADAVIGVRITSSTVAQGASEFLAYGTAVKLG